jgi:glycosyltransferase involved in cell wall biosynthesis
MQIHLYTLSWNEAKILPFFFRHYDRFVDRYFFFDDGSDDGTLEMLEDHPRVEVRKLERKFPSFLQSATHVRNNAWKASRGVADWVIATDVDEHLYHEDIRSYLAGCRSRGVTWLPALGYQMITPAFPEDGALLCRDHRMGVPYRLFDKVGLFDPDAIAETNFVPGRHFASPSGRIQYDDRDVLLNLHYKYLGADFVNRRYAELLSKIGSDKADEGAVDHWALHASQVETWMKAWADQAIDVGDRSIGRAAMASHPMDPSWWRPPPWWRSRWWHAHWWWTRVPARLRRIVSQMRRAALQSR